MVTLMLIGIAGELILDENACLLLAVAVFVIVIALTLTASANSADVVIFFIMSSKIGPL